MDDRRFDELSRLLGDAATRRAGLKVALAAVVGGPAAVAAVEARAAADKDRRRGEEAGPAAGKKKRRRKCKPACPAGQTCVKGECACENGGTVCGNACCLIGQRCEGGDCVSDPRPGECVASGEPCKGTGRPCCDGRVCASGQGGYGDVACYVPKTGACASTADCVYGMSCQGGRCAPPAPVEELGGACDATSQQLCAYPGAVCTAYTAAAAPGGTYCTLPVGAVCTGDPDCTCYMCFYPNGSVAPGGRRGRASANTKACCFPNGHECASESECCTGLSCVNGTCAGTLCAPDGVVGCGDAKPCCNPAATCADGVCSTVPQCVERDGTCPAPGGCCTGYRCIGGACTDCQTRIDHLVNYGKNGGDGQSGSGNGEFNKPREVAFLADGRMLVADQSNSRIQIWTESGGAWSYQASIPAGTYGGTCPNIVAGSSRTAKPYALAVDPLDPGAFYYVEEYGCFVMGCTGSGTTWTCTPAIDETGMSQVVEINDLAFDGKGRMFAVQESGPGDALMIDRPAGGWAANSASWPLAPAATFFANADPGKSSNPAGIAVGADGTVYVADTGNSRVTVWKETSPGTFAFDSQFGTFGTGAGNLKNPRGVAVQDGIVTVTDSGNARISLWKNVGGTWTNTVTFPDPATAGSSAAQLNNPSHCTPSADGRYYVADTTNNRISVWTEQCL